MCNLLPDRERPASGIVADTDEEELADLRELVTFLRLDVHTQQVRVEELRKMASEAFRKLAKAEVEHEALLKRLEEMRYSLVAGNLEEELITPRAIDNWLGYLVNPDPEGWSDEIEEVDIDASSSKEETGVKGLDWRGDT